MNTDCNCNECFSKQEQVANPVKDFISEQEQMLKDAYNSTNLIQTCKRCQNQFFITEGERDWLKSKGFDLFTHCPSCRALRKKERLDKLKKENEEMRKELDRQILVKTPTKTDFERYLAGDNK